jgi:hypothetical protein
LRWMPVSYGIYQSKNTFGPFYSHQVESSQSVKSLHWLQVLIGFPQILKRECK